MVKNQDKPRTIKNYEYKKFPLICSKKKEEVSRSQAIVLTGADFKWAQKNTLIHEIFLNYHRN